MKAARVMVMSLGVLLAAVGFRYLLDEDVPDLVDALIWLAGGVVAHDALLAPATLVLMVVASRFLPTWLRAPVTVGFVVLATVTIAAIPVLGRFGARPDNPTLLDRNYVSGWLMFAAAVALVVAVAAVRRHRDRVDQVSS